MTGSALQGSKSGAAESLLGYPDDSKGLGIGGGNEMFEFLDLGTVDDTVEHSLLGPGIAALDFPN